MSTPPAQPFAPGTLWNRVTQATETALARGVLQPISTELAYVKEAGVTFPVRRISHLAAKEQAASLPGRAHSPFLQADSALQVDDASKTHVCLLNRFPVFENHLLIVTREYEDQLRPLALQDFQALWKCMAEYNALGFYNGGAAAGASQRHMHLQMVPLPLSPRGPGIPIEPLLERATFKGEIGHCRALPFAHAVTKLTGDAAPAMPTKAADTLLLYRGMLENLGVNPDAPQLEPYNLVVTRRWMLIVPRSRDKFRTISLNALAFAGHFLVREPQEIDLLREHGPIQVLREVAVT